MEMPSEKDRVVRVSAYLTDQDFGYEHWRAAQFCAPCELKAGLLLLFDTKAERDAVFERGADVLTAALKDTP